MCFVTDFVMIKFRFTFWKRCCCMYGAGSFSAIENFTPFPYITMSDVFRRFGMHHDSSLILYTVFFSSLVSAANYLDYTYIIIYKMINNFSNASKQMSWSDAWQANESNDIPSLSIDAFSVLIVILKLFNLASVFDTLADRMGWTILLAYNLPKLRWGKELLFFSVIILGLNQLKLFLQPMTLYDLSMARN